MVPKGLEMGTGKVGNWRTHQDHANYSIVENGQNTEKGSGDLRKFAVTQIPVKKHQLRLVWETCKEYNNDNEDNNSGGTVSKGLEKRLAEFEIRWIIETI